jgi:hypothetical protein
MASKPAGRGGRPSCSRTALTGGGSLGEQRGKNGGGASPGEGGLAGGHLINDGAQREKVGAGVERLALRLFNAWQAMGVE